MDWFLYDIGLRHERVNHARVIKATAPKVALMKGTNLNRPLDF